MHVNENFNAFAQYLKSFYSITRCCINPLRTENEVRITSISIIEAQLTRALKTQNIKTIYLLYFPYQTSLNDI